MRTRGVLHDGPTDLRTPGALVRSIQRSHQVVLPQGPVRGTLITRHVSGQGSIGYVDTSMPACVCRAPGSPAQRRPRPALAISIAQREALARRRVAHLEMIRGLNRFAVDNNRIFFTDVLPLLLISKFA
jgi:hypothetical protein